MSQQLCRLLNVRVVVEGEWQPTPLTVFNHLSYLDILVILAQSPVILVAKSDVRGWPIIGKLAERAGAIFVERECRMDVIRASDELDSHVEDGRRVVLFPEGTSSDGRTVLPFHSSLFASAARKQMPVTPGAIRYELAEGDPAKDVCWWGDMTLVPHLWRLLQFREIRAFLRFGPPIQSCDRKQLSRQLHDSVTQLASQPQGSHAKPALECVTNLCSANVGRGPLNSGAIASRSTCTL